MCFLATVILPSGFLNEIPHRRHHEQIFVRQFKKRLGQDRGFVMQGDIFIDNAVHFPLDQARAAFHGYTAGTEALLGDRYPEFFR